MIKQLHPTLKKCACGFIGDRKALYKHFDKQREIYKALHSQHTQANSFWSEHGEVPLNADEQPSAVVTTSKQ